MLVNLVIVAITKDLERFPEHVSRKENGNLHDCVNRKYKFGLDLLETNLQMLIGQEKQMKQMSLPFHYTFRAKISSCADPDSTNRRSR